MAVMSERPHSPTAEAAITLDGLISARWVVIGLLAMGVAVMAMGPEAAGAVLGREPTWLATVGVAMTLIGWAALNVLTAWIHPLEPTIARGLAGVHSLVDVVALTVCLALTGGAANPFTMLYFVPVTLATQVSPRWTSFTAGASFVGFAVLFSMTPVPRNMTGHADHFVGHLQGMWLAFGLSGLLITTLVRPIALRLAEQREQLAKFHQQAQEDRHLASLGALAAGAAHELGTPLATIAVLVGELEFLTDDDYQDAIASIQLELKRCKSIVLRMATPDVRVEALASDDGWPLEQLADDIRGACGRDGTVEVRLDPSVTTQQVTQPFETLSQIVRELVTNAKDATRRSSSKTPVSVMISVVDRDLRVEVCDRGEGMDEQGLRRAFDPFVTTKPEGEGMGMGLYLVRVQVRQLGGRVWLDSNFGEGTVATLTLPVSGVLELGDRGDG